MSDKYNLVSVQCYTLRIQLYLNVAVFELQCSGPVKAKTALHPCLAIVLNVAHNQWRDS